MKKNIDLQKVSHNRGAAVITAVFFFIIISSAIALTLAPALLRDYKTSADFTKSKTAYYLAESGIEDVVYRLKKSITTGSQVVLTLNGNTATTTTTTVDTMKSTVATIGDVTTDTRKIGSTVTNKNVGAFRYATQVGQGGITMRGSATITGDAYASGPICGGGTTGTSCTVPTYRGGGSIIGYGGSASVTPSVTAQSGDLVILIASVDRDWGTFTWPSGFTENAVTASSHLDGQSIRFATKIAGGSEPSSYSISNNAWADFAYAVVIYSGVDTSNPIDVTPTVYVDSNDYYSPWTLTATGVAAGTPNRLLLGIKGIDVSDYHAVVSAPPTGTSPSSWTLRVDSNPTTDHWSNLAVFDALDTGGSYKYNVVSTTDAASGSSSGGRMVFLLALRSVLSGSGTSVISGKVIASGGNGINGLTHRIQNQGLNSMYASYINASTISGSAYCSTIANSNISTCNPVVAHPVPILPFGTNDISAWESAATAGGTVTCSSGSYTASTTMNFGPKKIPCDLKLTGGVDEGTRKTITLQGPVWATGSITISGYITIRVDPSLTGLGMVLIADDSTSRTTGSQIKVNDHNTIFTGSSSGSSWVVLVSGNTAASTGATNDAINLQDNVQGDVILYAPSGSVVLRGSSSVDQVTAYILKMQDTANISYVTGLINTLIYTGPGTYGWETQSWKLGQ